VLMDEMRRATAREKQDRRKQDRFASTLTIAASIIASVRLARDDISRPSPRLSTVVPDSVGLARMILVRVASNFRIDGDTARTLLVPAGRRYLKLL